jgi:hypothetical protein
MQGLCNTDTASSRRYSYSRLKTKDEKQVGMEVTSLRAVDIEVIVKVVKGNKLALGLVYTFQVGQ